MTALEVKGTDWINSCNTKRSRQQWPLCCFSFIIYYKPILHGEFIGDVHVHEKKMTYENMTKIANIQNSKYYPTVFVDKWQIVRPS